MGVPGLPSQTFAALTLHAEQAPRDPPRSAPPQAAPPAAHRSAGNGSPTGARPPPPRTSWCPASPPPHCVPRAVGRSRRGWHTGRAPQLQLHVVVVKAAGQVQHLAAHLGRREMPRSAAIQAPCHSSASSGPNSNHPGVPEQFTAAPAAPPDCRPPRLGKQTGRQPHGSAGVCQLRRGRRASVPSGSTAFSQRNSVGLTGCAPRSGPGWRWTRTTEARLLLEVSRPPTMRGGSLNSSARSGSR